ncbi:tRNA(fMet)-specific endonuclease VapC [Tepidimonas alkaliphilus]|uniref:Ribonuclease VapC n=1 Tax=Tepidimonas alkaliphilus TaxID=2588942 RepID=A0A554WD39_9BURK|nr:putative toxin-antitoxin system toxin component, PIN family [Tepidimonas alkaliphilus]TSE21503.1 tRNA(fMet)-specific endonuclease VapC [Tepidimonas alkaliphilus]
MRLVLDTDVVVAALRSPAGASAEVLRLARRGRLVLAASVSLFMEYEAVCRRPSYREAAGLSEADVEVFLDALALLVEPVPIHYLWRPQLRDPADELVLEAAVNAGANTLLTFNVRHFRAAAGRFGLPVSPPGPWLARFLQRDPR